MVSLLTRLGLLRLVLERGGVRRLALAGFVWRFLPRRLRLYAVSFAALIFIGVAGTVIAIVLLASGSL